MDKNFQFLLDHMKQEEDNGDQERRHVNADNILVDALKLLAQDTEYQDIIQEICDRYNSMSFWSA